MPNVELGGRNGGASVAEGQQSIIVLLNNANENQRTIKQAIDSNSGGGGVGLASFLFRRNWQQRLMGFLNGASLS